MRPPHFWSPDHVRKNSKVRPFPPRARRRKDNFYAQRFGEELRKIKLFDNSIVGTPQEAVDFIGNILESSTEYSIVGNALDCRILLWNEGARRLYGYEPAEVVGRANSSILHVPEDVESGRHRRTHGFGAARRRQAEQIRSTLVS